MTRLIDSDLFYKWVDEHLLYDLARQTILSGIKNAPTIDAAPVVYGEWKVDSTKYSADCSVCSWPEKYDDAIQYSYCPNCGAKMK